MARLLKIFFCFSMMVAYFGLTIEAFNFEAWAGFLAILLCSPMVLFSSLVTESLENGA